MGDSVGRWDGDTLVVDTTNFTDQTGSAGRAQDLHVVERFTRVDDRQRLLYRFTVEDPARGPHPWTGEYTWPATDERSVRVRLSRGELRSGEHDARRPAARGDARGEAPSIEWLRQRQE